MKTQYYTASTLDGFIAASDDSLEWLFELGPIENSSYSQFIKQVGALVMGSATYRWLLSHTEQVIAETGSAWPYKQPVWVMTTQLLPVVPGADIRFAQGPVANFFPSIQQSANGNNIWIVGGGELAGQFYDAGLLDELIIQIGSSLLGEGKRLLPRLISATQLQLLSTTVFGPKMVELRYEILKKS